MSLAKLTLMFNTVFLVHFSFSRNYEKYTPLNSAAAAGHTEIVNFFLGEGVPVDLADRRKVQ